MIILVRRKVWTPGCQYAGLCLHPTEYANLRQRLQLLKILSIRMRPHDNDSTSKDPQKSSQRVVPQSDMAHIGTRYLGLHNRTDIY